MQAEAGSIHCPPEDAIECWAIQDVMRKTPGGERPHLDRCGSCRAVHTAFVRFYEVVNRHALQLFVAKRRGIPRSFSPEKPGGETRFLSLSPLDLLDEARLNRSPVALSETLVSDLWGDKANAKHYVSSDGTVIGRFLTVGGPMEWSFQLMSPEERFVRRTVLHLPEDDSFHPCDDSGYARLWHWSGNPSDTARVEVVPFLAAASYAVDAVSTGGEIPGIVTLDAGVLGSIVVEQEEGDHGEAVLHLLLPELPSSLLRQRLVIALSTPRGLCFAEEAIGREIYLYGPDLLQNFGLWVYAR